MNTGEIYSAYCVGHEHLSSAKVISGEPPRREDILRLRIAQEHVEAMWLGEFPAIIVLNNAKPSENLIHLYDNTYLVLREDWDIIENAEPILLNQRFIDEFAIDTLPWIDLRRVMSPSELVKTFENTAFVFALTLHDSGE